MLARTAERVVLRPGASRSNAPLRLERRRRAGHFFEEVVFGFLWSSRTLANSWLAAEVLPIAWYRRPGGSAYRLIRIQLYGDAELREGFLVALLLGVDAPKSHERFESRHFSHGLLEQDGGFLQIILSSIGVAEIGQGLA